MKVLFAPDYRDAVPYQALLADALSNYGVEVGFFQNDKRLFPLTRESKKYDLVHLHWPEYFFKKRGALLNAIRFAHYRFDLNRLKTPFVLTAHNVYPHSRKNDSLTRKNIKYTHSKASCVFAHAIEAMDVLKSAFGNINIQLIPFGDFSTHYGIPLNKYEARRLLNIKEAQPIALMFGSMQPYKGIEEIISWWHDRNIDVCLYLVGRITSNAYKNKIETLIKHHPNIVFKPTRGLSDEALKTWICAANCVVFNYKQILTSGGAPFVRSYGIPLLIPERNKTVELGEPDTHVLRFKGSEDFEMKLQAAVHMKPNYKGAATWRKTHSWNEVARITAETYQQIIKS